MAKYFNNFPKVDYSINSPNSYDYVTSIVSRFVIDEKLKNNAVAFYTYNVKDGETPEILASKIYGSPERHWIILMMNDIVDPMYDWPLSYKNFNDYVDSKYSTSEFADTANSGISGISWSQNIENVKSYYKVITKTTSSNVQVTKVEVDSNTYENISITNNNYLLEDGGNLTVSVGKGTQTYYDYETELNENKRRIKILKTDFVSGLENELTIVFE